MAIIDSWKIVGIVRNTLDRVDRRLVHHGARVAFQVACMLLTEGGHSSRELHDSAFLGLLHDIGAYKTEEIDRMLQFEAANVWEHSVYGYLFLKYLSPLADGADAILYHHTDADRLRGMDGDPALRLAQMINIADRADMYWQTGGVGACSLLNRWRGRKFAPGLLDLYERAQRRYAMEEHILAGDYDGVLQELAHGTSFSGREIDAYLKMLIFAIDFRSYHTVTHTITTTSVGSQLARLLGSDMPEKVYYGALLHDLGKIGIPVEILEFPGKLSPQAMTIMRTHVDMTEQILDGRIDGTATRIALRHHEKLDGSGYPRGLKAESLTLEERIVAVADIVSALCGTRSYKKAFPKELTLSILGEQARNGLLDPLVVEAVAGHFDQLMDCARQESGPVIAAYERISSEYQELLDRCKRLTEEDAG